VTFPAGEDVTVDMEKNVLINHTTGKEYVLKDLGDVSVSAGLWVVLAVLVLV
jgi:hypothetical protein